MKWLKLSLLALVFYILYLTICQVGIGPIFDNVHRVGFGFLWILWVYPVIFAFDTLGWAYAFLNPIGKIVPFHSLYKIRIIGETLNAVIPFSASLGGEPIKVLLLKKQHNIPTSDGYASILIVHTTFWISLNAFVIGGILLTSKTRPLTPVLFNSVLAFLIGLGVTAGLLIIGLHFGIFKQVHSIGEKFKLWGHKSEEKSRKFLKLDGRIREFFTKNPKRFWMSSFYNFLGWLTGAFEVLIIGNILGMNLNFAEAWLLESLIQVLRIVTFFIPSSIGAQEGGIVLIFQQFGFATPMSMTFALVRRIREILWVALGLALWATVKEKPIGIYGNHLPD